MKRALVILSVFVGLFVFLCITGCSCGNCDFDTDATMDVATYSCLECDRSNGVETLNGCHLVCDSLDCYWFPTACGCYENDFSENPYYQCISCPSLVVFGCDVCMTECYGDSGASRGTDIEKRQTVLADEGVDYVIDKMTVNVDNHTYELSNGEINMEDFKTFIELINLEKAVSVDFYIEFTVLNELHSAIFSGEFVYDSYLDNGFPKGFKKGLGNIDTYQGEENRKSKNIAPGKHILTAKVEMNLYELLSFEDIKNVGLTAYVYGEEE